MVLAPLHLGVPELHELCEGEADVVGVLVGGGRQSVQGGEELARFAQLVDQVVDEPVNERTGAHGPADPVEPLGDVGVQGQQVTGQRSAAGIDHRVPSGVSSRLARPHVR